MRSRLRGRGDRRGKARRTNSNRRWAAAFQAACKTPAARDCAPLGPPPSGRQAPWLNTPLLRVRSPFTQLLFDARSFPAVRGRARRASALVCFSFLRIRRVGRGLPTPGKLRPFAHRIGRLKTREARAPTDGYRQHGAQRGGLNSCASGRPRAGRFRSAPRTPTIPILAGFPRPLRLHAGASALTLIRLPPPISV